MQTSLLGATGLRVSRLGLGTVELGLPYGIGKAPPPGDEDCIRLLRQARDLGVTYFDTASVYGRSEELVGRALAGSKGVVVATKVPLRDERGRPLRDDELAGAVARSLDRSRRRLDTEALDVVQLHSLDDPGRLDPALLEVMVHQVESGRVRHWGVSTYGRQASAAALDQCRTIEVLQVAYSVLDRTLEGAILPRCQAQGVGLVVRSVFLQGVLSDRRRCLDGRLGSLRRAADQVSTVAEGLGLALPEVALRFALYESGAHVTLVGTASRAELDLNLGAAAAGPLPRDAVAALRAVRIDDEKLLNPGNWPEPAPRTVPRVP